MYVLSLLVPALLQLDSANAFAVRVELQSLYDEISQATLQFETDADVDDFYAVLYAADWTFIDADGHRHSWAEVRPQVIEAMNQPRPDSIRQAIKKISSVPGGAVVDVTETQARIVVDADGRYGRKGEIHTVVETTSFHDEWVGSGGLWKVKSRRQVGASRTSVEKMRSGW